MTDASFDIGRAEWDLLQSARHLRDIVRRHPEAKDEVDSTVLDEAIAEVMGIVGELSTATNLAERARQKEGA